MTESTITRELAALEDALAGRPVDPEFADLDDLVAALREERPEPAPAFTAALDRRTSMGFPRVAKPSRRRRSGRAKWPRMALPALGVAASLLLAVVIAGPSLRAGNDDSGTSGGGTSADTSASGGSSSSSARDSDGSGGSGATSSSGSSKGAPAPPSSGQSAPSVMSPLPTPAPPPSADGRRRRSVERSAELTLAARPSQIDTAAAAILRVTDQVGGYVVSSTVSSRSGGEFSLRVPERRLQEALSRLGRVGRVRSRTQSAQDITAVAVSARERLTDARTERRSLLRQLAKATTPNQGSSIRRRLRIVSGQIAAAKRDLRRVQARAANATVSVSLVAERGSGAPSDDDGAWTPGDALRDATRVLEITAGVLLVALAAGLPVGLLALLAWIATRRTAQRRRERALDAV